MEHFDINAYTPVEMAKRVETAGIAKARLDLVTMLVLAMLAGAFIALGAMFYTFTVHNAGLSTGLIQLIGGLVFSLGLILVVIAGAELFTGNNLIVMAYVSGDISLQALLRNWCIVYLGNFFGALVMVVLVYLTNHWLFAGVGERVLMIASKKVSMPFMEALTKGVLCNVLVCLAVWLCYAGRSVTDKILAIIFPITAFVAMGFEHSVANMYFVPAGLVLSSDAAMLNQLAVTADYSELTVMNFLFNNLLPVTLGNIIGGGFFVAVVYWFVYLRKQD